MGLPDHLKRDRVPFWKADPRTWPLVVELMAGKEWPPEVVDDDLWWWMDQVVKGYASEIPSRRALMVRWTWTERRVRDRLQVLGDWRAEWTSQQGPTDVPTRSQRGPNEVPADNVGTGPIAAKGPSKVPARSRQGPTDVPTRSTRAVEQRTETDVQRTESEQEQPPADPPPAIRDPVLVHPVASPPDDWTQLAEHYAGLPRHQLPESRRKGVGKHLASMLAVLGLDTAIAMIDWWHRGACEKAAWLRRGGKDRPPPKLGAPPAYGVSTLAVHAEDYRPFVIAWIEQGRPREYVPLKALSIPEQRARDVISDGPTPIQRKLAEQAAKRAKEKP